VKSFLLLLFLKKLKADYNKVAWLSQEFFVLSTKGGNRVAGLRNNMAGLIDLRKNFPFQLLRLIKKPPCTVTVQSGRSTDNLCLYAQIFHCSSHRTNWASNWFVAA